MITPFRLLATLLIAALLSSTPARAATPEQEKEFTALLNNVTLAGRWCLVRDGELTPERDETYAILGVEKAGADQWVVKAQMKYQGQPIIAPVPVRVEWAGGAPVMIVDNLTIPGGGTYSARVLFHGKTYSGTWSGGDKTGLLHGIVKAAQ